MFILEYKLRGKPSQYQAIDEAIGSVNHYSRDSGAFPPFIKLNTVVTNNSMHL